MATKVFFYTLRPYDELGIAQRLAPQLDVEFGSTQEYPTLENAELAKGYEHAHGQAVSRAGRKVHLLPFHRL